METMVLSYVALVGGTVLYYHGLCKLLFHNKLRCVYNEKSNFYSYRIFYRFIMFPWDIVRITYKFSRVYKMDALEFLLYQCKHADPEMYENMVKIQEMVDKKKS